MFLINIQEDIMHDRTIGVSGCVVGVAVVVLLALCFVSVIHDLVVVTSPLINWTQLLCTYMRDRQ